MAKRPIKKRKQRKVVKKKPILAKKPKVLNPKFKLTIGGDDHDRFFVHPETVPDGVALQWVGSDSETKPNIDQATQSGWKPVKEQPVIEGLILVWAPQALADAQQQENINRAIAMDKDLRDALGMIGIGDKSHKKGTSFGLIPSIVHPSFGAGHQYTAVPSDAPPIDVEVTTKFRMSARLQDAAASLNLDPQVYAQRRLALYLRGALSGILVPIEGTAFELFENVNIGINSRNL